MSLAEDAAGVSVRVCDCGDGVLSGFVPRLFEPFARGFETEEGHGARLGLAIAKGLAEVDSGEVWREPNEPRGACFCLRLPKPPLA